MNLLIIITTYLLDMHKRSYDFWLLHYNSCVLQYCFYASCDPAAPRASYRDRDPSFCRPWATSSSVSMSLQWRAASRWHYKKCLGFWRNMDETCVTNHGIKRMVCDTRFINVLSKTETFLVVWVHVATVCFMHFKCMLHMFHLDVSKVDLLLHKVLGYTHMLQVYVSNILADVCSKCFI
jgi:hypothetical protein